MKLHKVVFATLAGLAFSFSLVSGASLSSENSSRNDWAAKAYLGDGSTDALFNRLVTNSNSDGVFRNTYAAYYFDNLRTNFGNNVFGSCGYVSIGMLLSFYDAYWDDSFIPNSYDVNSAYAAERQSGADFDLVPLNTESPGIRFEPSDLVQTEDIEQYLGVADENKDIYFQFKLFDLAKSCFGTLASDGENASLGLSGQDIYAFLNYYTQSYQSHTSSEVSVSLLQATYSSSIKKDVISKIDDGTPTLLIVRQPDSLKTHAVIAYDRDFSDEIYVHPGWRDESKGVALTHVSLSDLGYTEILSGISLNVNTQKNLGLKYYSQSGEGSSASSFIFPREIKLESGNFGDSTPKFSWKSLYSEKWEKDKDPYFNLTFLDSSGRSVVEIKKIKGLSWTLDRSQWGKVRFDVPGEKYDVLVRLDSDAYPYWDEYWCKTRFQKPETYEDKPYILPNEYGFADAYPTDEKTKTEFEKHTVRGFSFETRRYRVGYIHKEDIVMSPIRKGINEAFIEYRFDTALVRIDVDLSHWREQMSELLSKNNGTAVIQQFIQNKWVTVLDLLSDETGLPRDRNNKNSYEIEFSQPAYRIRFYSQYNGVSTSDSNKGRICIGSMAFYPTSFRFPLSGAELDYKGEEWTTSDYNCYGYALNTKKHGFMQPGQSDGFHQYDKDYFTKDFLEKMVELDAASYHFTFKPISKNQRCDDGFYKVALVVAPKVDYHWYRQNSDGSWSHKRGRTAAQLYDADSNLIYDPVTCNRKYDVANYTVFCGFYQVDVSNMI